MYPSLLLWAVVALAVFMWVLGWVRRDSPLAGPYLALTSAFLVWTLAYIWELEAQGIETMILAAKVQHLGIQVVPPAILVFCLRYVGQDSFPSKPTLAFLSLVPVATVAMAWTNEFHGLIWKQISVTPIGTGSVLNLEYGAFFGLSVLVSYSLLLISLMAVAQTFMRSTALFRRQSALVLAGLLFPWAANLLQVTGLNPLRPLDLTPLSLVLTCGFAAAATLNLKLLTVSPVARDLILSATTDGVVVVDSVGRVIDVNRPAAGFLGITPRDAIGSSATDVLGPFSSVMDVENRDGMLVTLGVKGFDRTFHCTWVDVEGRSGRRLGGALEIHDVTDLTGLHRALSSAKEALEEEVKAQTRELTDAYIRLTDEMEQRKRAQTHELALEARLRHSQKLETVGTLAGGIAHDFNNILTSIMGYTDLALERSGADAALRGYLSHVAAASHRAKALVEQILTFSRRVETELRPVSLRPVIEEVAGLMRSTLPSTIEITQSIDQECGPVKADPTQIHQLLMNLGTNAQQSMRAEGGTLEIRLDKAVAEGEFDAEHIDVRGRPCARLTVRDTGIGIDEGTRERLFEPFFTTRPHGEGTGLGLSVVHGIVLGHKGAIRITSEPGRGTSFSVYLALVDAVEEPYESSNGKPKMGSERLLIVDDEEQITTMLKASLGALGYDVTTFTDSQAALTAFVGSPEAFDLVITDQTMPNLTGVELAEHITSIRPDLPIILQTGLKESTGANVDQTTSFTSLQKPLSTGELTTAIRTALD